MCHTKDVNVKKRMKVELQKQMTICQRMNMNRQIERRHVHRRVSSNASAWRLQNQLKSMIETKNLFGDPDLDKTFVAIKESFVWIGKI